MISRVAPILLGLIVGLIGCGPRAADRADFALSLSIETPPDQRVLYRTTRAGEIQFAGGRDALFETPSWTGDLTDEEILELDAILRETNWFRPRPTDPGDAAGPEASIYDVTIEAPNGRRRFTVTGGTAAIAAAEAILEAAATRRLDDYLSRQPRPEAPPASDDP